MIVQIVIPTRNSESTIEKCLDSVLIQSYKEWELLVVDDNSLDRTVEICKEVGEVIVGAFNRSEARNYALQNSKARYFAFVDSDCVLPPDWLKVTLSGMQLSDPDVGAIGGFYKTPKGVGLWSRLVGFELETRRERFKGRRISRLPTGGLLIKREVLEKVPFDERLSTAEETDWAYRLTRSGYRIVYFPEADVWHYHRSSLWKYFKQQLEYGYRIPDFYLKNARALKGDHITSFWMNIQPPILLLAVILLALKIPHLLVGLSSYWILLAISNSLSSRSILGLGLVSVYPLRCVAWALGGIAWIFRRFLRRIGMLIRNLRWRP